MITRRSLVGMATWTVSAAAIGAAPDKPAARKNLSDRDQIAAGTESFVAAYNAGDLAAFMSHYAEDLVKCRQGGSTETKKDTAARNFQVFQTFQSTLSVTTEEIVTSGDMAYTRGTFRVVLKPRQGGPDRVIERRFLEILQKQGGQWLVTRTMDNAIIKPGNQSRT